MTNRSGFPESLSAHDANGRLYHYSFGSRNGNGWSLVVHYNVKARKGDAKPAHKKTHNLRAAKKKSRNGHAREHASIMPQKKPQKKRK